MKEMEQILHSLKETLKDQEKALADFQDNTVETEAEWITLGWTEALTFAIKQIEDALYEEVQVTKHMSIKQKKGAVNALNYLLTGERGTNGTEESN
tara:strand:+ start:658 stop:945 length:288 start_codon:yes stop_codon:yes gene_type:complete